MEQELFELDMERQYEDSSFALDTVNCDLQCASQELVSAQVELVYDEYLAAIMRLYYNPEFYRR